MNYLSMIIVGIVMSVVSGCYCAEIAVINASSSKELIARLDDTHTTLSQDAVKNMLLQLGELGDQAALPVLQRYFANSSSKRSDTVGGCAQVALAKLSDDNAFNEIVQETTTNNIIVYHDSFKKLGMIGNKKAINVLGQYLFIDKTPPRKVAEETVGPHGETRQGVMKMFLPSYLSSQILATILGDKSPTSTNPDFYTNSDIQKWREWWVANSNKYYISSTNIIAGTQAVIQPSTNSIAK